MIERRPFEALPGDERAWLKAKHHFLFDSKDAWGALFIWNDDEIAPAGDFAPHFHANMEIATYVRRGAISHHDSLGNRGRTAAGDVQGMSARTGKVLVNGVEIGARNGAAIKDVRRLAIAAVKDSEFVLVDVTEGRSAPSSKTA